MTPMNHEIFMGIGPHVFPKSGTQTHRQTDVAALYIDHGLFNWSFNIVFCWLSSHVGITSNEKLPNLDKINQFFKYL